MPSSRLRNRSDQNASLNSETTCLSRSDTSGSTRIMSSSSSSSMSNGEPSTAASSSTPTPTPTLKRYEAVLADELKLQTAQYPTTEEVPGCMTLFDDFLSCYALGPQMRNVYRHGTIRDCTYKFEDFKYCMSLKSSSEEEKRALWVRRKAEWWASRRVGGSSEDVWNVRSAPPPNFPPNFPQEAEAASSITTT